MRFYANDEEGEKMRNKDLVMEIHEMREANYKNFQFVIFQLFILTVLVIWAVL